MNNSFDNSLNESQGADEPKLQEVLPKAGLVYSEKGNLSEVLCKPKIMAIKSPSLEKLEEMEKLATTVADPNVSQTAAACPDAERRCRSELFLAQHGASRLPLSVARPPACTHPPTCTPYNHDAFGRKYVAVTSSGCTADC